MIAGALFGVWLIAVAAVALVVLAVLNGWQPERLRAGLETAASKLLDHEIQVGRLEGGLLDGLTLHDVSVAERREAGGSARPLVARRIAIQIDFGESLRRRVLVVSELTIVQPAITLSRTDERGFVLEGWGPLETDESAGAGSASGPPFPIEVSRGHASDVHLALGRDFVSGLEDVAGRLDLDVAGLRFTTASGLPWPDEASLRFDLGRGRLRERDLGQGRLVAGTDGSTLTIETLELDGPLGAVSLDARFEFGGRLDSPETQTGRLDAQIRALDLDALLDLSPPERKPPIIEPLSGRLTLQIDQIGDDPRDPGADYRLSLHAITEPSRVFGGRIEKAELNATLSLADDRWSLDESVVELKAGRVLVSAHGIGLMAESFEATADGLDLARLPKSWLPPARLAGRADLALSLHGRFEDPIGSFEASARGVHVDDVGPGSLELALRARGDRQYVLDEFDWKFEPGAGRLAGTRIRSIGAPTVAFGADSITVEQLAVDWTGGSMVVDGGIVASEFAPSHVELDSLDVGVVSRLLGIPGEPEGVMSGRLDLSGPIRDPDIEAKLEWEAPRYQGLDVDRIHLEVSTEARRRSVDAVFAQADREPLRLVARVPRVFDLEDPRGWLADPRFGLDLHAANFDLVWLAPLLAAWDLEPAGHLDGEVKTAGGRSGPTAHGALRLAAARLDALPRDDPEAPAVFGPVTGLIRFEGSEIETEALHYGDGADEAILDATLGWSGERAQDLDLAASLIGLGFRGRATLSAGLRGDVLETSVLALDDFGVAELARGLGITGELGGHLTGEFVIEGPLADPDFRTRLTWHDPVVARVRADRLVVEAKREDHGLSLHGTLERGGRQVLDVEGSLPLARGASIDEWLERPRGWAGDPDTRIELTAARFPLDWLPILAPGLPLETDGFVTGSVTLRGADSVPWIEGELTIDQGVFSLATQTTSVGPLSGTIEFEGSSARFDPLKVVATRGRATLAGSVRWSAAGIDSVSVRTRFDGYRFDQLGLLKTTLDGSVLAEGPLHGLHVEGEIRLGEVRVSFPNQRNPVLKEIRVLGLPEKQSASIFEGEAEVAGIEDQTTVDVAIVLPQGTWIRGIGLDAEVVGRVNVTKDAGEDLYYTGQLQVQHGRYKLQGKRFELDRGVAVFTGGTSPIPDIDISGHRRASREVTVYAHVTGPADAPTLELTSQPPMDTAEIISYLFFGRSATVGNRESSRGLGQSAASVAGSMLVDSIAPELRNTLRIDEISVTSGEDDSPAVEIETQVTPDVYLRLVQSLGAAADEAVEVRWRFWKNLSLKSRVNRSGASAIDLLYEFNYWGLDHYGLEGFDPPPPFEDERPTPEDGASADPANSAVTAGAGDD